MNQQIEQLALQAGFNLHNDVIDGHDFKHEIEKLAELIVQKCIDTYDHWATHSMDKTAFVVARTHVKEHFGIEQ